jgi:glutamate racemase
LVTDTNLVDIVVDCKQREISFQWRQIHASSFLLEQNICAHATVRTITKRVYNKDLEEAGRRYSFVRTRGKRLVPWVEKNKHHMSPKMRLQTEIGVAGDTARIKDIPHHDNLGP